MGHAIASGHNGRQAESAPSSRDLAAYCLPAGLRGGGFHPGFFRYFLGALMRNLARKLGLLAAEFRGTRDEERRRQIAAEYESAVLALIESHCWHEIPPPEDELPDAFMPLAYFRHWGLADPK
jgi:hypothetical protein